MSACEPIRTLPVTWISDAGPWPCRRFLPVHRPPILDNGLHQSVFHQPPTLVTVGVFIVGFAVRRFSTVSGLPESSK
jgi:hypothetical protein